MVCLAIIVAHILTCMTKASIKPGLSCKQPHPGELKDTVLQEAPVTTGGQSFRYNETAMVSARSVILRLHF